MKKIISVLIAVYGFGLSNISYSQNMDFEYVAFIMCGSARTSVALCLVDPDNSNKNSILELINFNQRNVYTYKNISQAGTQTKSGLGIRLSKNFSLSVQNLNQNLSLSVTIFKKDDQNNPVFQQEARFGQSIKVSN